MSSERTKKEQKAHRDAPASDQPVAYRKHGSRGLSLVRALVGHGDTKPSRIAEIIAQHPADEDDVMEFVHEYFGNSFANKVQHALPAAERADKLNHDLDDYVDKEDRGHLSEGEDKEKKHADSNRLTDGGDKATVDGSAENPVPVVRNDGSKIGTISKSQALRVNSGAMSTIAIDDGEKEECVLGFKVKLDDGSTVAGWVPVDGLDDDTHSRAVVRTDRAISKRLKRRRPSGKELKNTSAWRVNLDADTSRFEGLYTMPKQNSNENKAEHYCKRPTTNVVNLLVNVPNTGGSRFGVPCDVLADGTTFNRIDNVAKGHPPLYEKKVTAEEAAAQNVAENSGFMQSPLFLTFVYGYTVNDANVRTYGWINEAMLEKA